MILMRHYYIAILGASLIHLAVLFLLSYSIEGGAKDKGEQGIEIDLGMLGELGKATETQESNSTSVEDEIEEVDITEPQQTIEEKVQEVIEEKPIIEEIEPIIESKQVAEIKVKKMPVKKVEIKQKEIEPVKEKIVEPIEEKVIESTQQTNLDSKPQKSVQATSDKQDNNQASVLKMSTGSADALTSGGNTGAQSSYYSVIAAMLAKYKRYPQYSRKRGQEGTVVLTFTVLRSGLVKNIDIKQSSGYRALDRAVKKMLKEALPFPAHEKAQEVKISIPIVFKLNQ